MFHLNSRFRSLIAWKRPGNFISLHLAYRKYNKRTKLRFVFGLFYTSKTIYSKNAQNQRAKLIFSKKSKILLFNVGLFQQVL